MHNFYPQILREKLRVNLREKLREKLSHTYHYPVPAGFSTGYQQEIHMLSTGLCGKPSVRKKA